MSQVSGSEFAALTHAWISCWILLKQRLEGFPRGAASDRDCARCAATHKHQSVKRWLRRNPRFHLHFTPTSSSWLNLVERWFRNLTQQRLRRGSFHHVKELISAINDYIDNNNQNPRVFVWSVSVEQILTKIAKCKEALDALH